MVQLGRWVKVLAVGKVSEAITTLDLLHFIFFLAVNMDLDGFKIVV